MPEGVTKFKTLEGSASLEPRICRVDRQQILIVNDPATVHLIRSGTGSVFSSQIENGFALGRRRFLFRARAGDAIFTLASSNTDALVSRLLVVATDELTIAEIPVDRMEEAFESEGIVLTRAI